MIFPCDNKIGSSLFLNCYFFAHQFRLEASSTLAEVEPDAWKNSYAFAEKETHDLPPGQYITTNGLVPVNTPPTTIVEGLCQLTGSHFKEPC